MNISVAHEDDDGDEDDGCSKMLISFNNRINNPSKNSQPGVGNEVDSPRDKVVNKSPTNQAANLNTHGRLVFQYMEHEQPYLQKPLTDKFKPNTACGSEHACLLEDTDCEAKVGFGWSRFQWVTGYLGLARINNSSKIRIKPNAGILDKHEKKREESRVGFYYYNTLEVDQNAEDCDFKKAYRRLAMKTHLILPLLNPTSSLSLWPMMYVF